MPQTKDPDRIKLQKIRLNCRKPYQLLAISIKGVNRENRNKHPSTSHARFILPSRDSSVNISGDVCDNFVLQYVIAAKIRGIKVPNNEIERVEEICIGIFFIE
jgi:hypothetical protein